MMKKKLYQSKVVSVHQCARDIFLLRLHEPALAADSRSGQFVEIQTPQHPDILWRRPFSIHNTVPDEGLVEILFHAIGRGTQALAKTKAGSIVDILGPLGRSFEYEDNLKHALVVAGGLGIAPFKLMQRELARRGVPMTLFYGVGSADQLCDVAFFREQTDLRVSTIDGSQGFHGLVTDLLVDYLQKCDSLEGKTVYVCGPTPMMQRVQEIVTRFDIPAQVTLETIMACGFGACVGCVVRMAQPQRGEKEYFLACKDGPVFKMNEIIIDD